MRGRRGGCTCGRGLWQVLLARQTDPWPDNIHWADKRSYTGRKLGHSSAAASISDLGLSRKCGWALGLGLVTGSELVFIIILVSRPDANIAECNLRHLGGLWSLTRLPIKIKSIPHQPVSFGGIYSVKRLKTALLPTQFGLTSALNVWGGALCDGIRVCCINNPKPGFKKFIVQRFFWLLLPRN